MNTIVLAAQGAAPAGGGMGGMLIMMILLFAIMYFFMIRPQQKRQKEIRNFQNTLKEGDKVVTGGGLHATVRRINLSDGTIDVEISRGVVVTIDRNYVFAAAQPQNA